jgi:hypothetical protein
MNTQEIKAQGELFAREGKPAAYIAQFLVGCNIMPEVASGVAEQLVQEHGPKLILPAFDGRKLLYQEIDRLNVMFEQLGLEVFDSKKIWTMFDEWSAGITQNLLMYWREEYEPMEFPTGTRVRRVEPENYVPGSSVIEFGEIIVNHFRYLLEQNPYDGLIPARTEEQMARLKGLG